MSCITIICALAGILSVPVKADETSMEEIYIVRSVRISNAPATEYCATTIPGISNVTDEGHFTFRSVATRASDGRVIDANAIIGRVHLCGGIDGDHYPLYGDFTVNNITFKGVGDCHSFQPNAPERGLTNYSCEFELSGLPSEYSGGKLTTNSMTSLKGDGIESEPNGYTQVSIATIRLWKKRVQ